MAQAEQEFLVDDASALGLQDLMKLMAVEGGSDLYVSVGAQIKMKINGEMFAVSPSSISPDDVALMLTEKLSSDQLTTLDNTKELNCSLSIPKVGRFRMSAFHQRSSKAFVLRFIPPEIPPFEALGMPDILTDLVMLKRGLVIVSGPTGSGKSTTLASLLNHRNETRPGHIITIEDPIEFLFRHRKSIVNQREIGTDALSYEEALKNAMRQAPDVILIGEIRDRTTMSMAMQYAQSGHLCLATLHANNAYNALNRIVGFYPPEQREALYSDLSSSLRAIVSQRLIPSSFGGRVAAVEVMVCNRGIQELISKGSILQIPDRMESNSTDGSQTFESVLVQMVSDQRISKEDALLYSDSPTNLYWKLSQRGLATTERIAVEAGVDRSTIAQGQSGQGNADFTAIKIKASDA